MDEYAAAIRQGKLPTDASICDSGCPEAQGHRFLIVFLATGVISLHNYSFAHHIFCYVVIWL